MNKMILMSILALSAGSLFGMENPELNKSKAEVISELYDAVLDNTNQVFGLSNRQRLLNDLRDAIQSFNWQVIGDVQNPERARLTIDYFIDTIEVYVDPKSGFKLTTDERDRLTKALEYLNKLRGLL